MCKIFVLLPGIEAQHADYLLEHLRPPGADSDAGLVCIHERISVHYHDILDIVKSNR